MRKVEECSAMESRKCRATKNLERVVIKAPESKGLMLPHFLLIFLCPKHFRLRGREEPSTERSKA